MPLLFTSPTASTGSTSVSLHDFTFYFDDPSVPYYILPAFFANRNSTVENAGSIVLDLFGAINNKNRQAINAECLCVQNCILLAPIPCGNQNNGYRYTYQNRMVYDIQPNLIALGIPV